MLKLIYAETALHLQFLSADLVDWVERQRKSAAKTGEFLSVSSGRATMLLPTQLCEIAELTYYLDRERVRDVTVCHCDRDRVEICFNGYWLTGVNCDNVDAVDGIFVTELSNRVEAYLLQLQYAAKAELN
jgi:hypothetical protein